MFDRALRTACVEQQASFAISLSLISCLSCNLLMIMSCIRVHEASDRFGAMIIDVVFPRWVTSRSARGSVT